MIIKNIYTMRVLDIGDLPCLLKGKTGRLTWLVLVQEDVQWSAETIIPDFSSTDQFEMDIIFDDDFRKTTDVSVGDRFDIDFSIATDKRSGIHKVEVVDIRKDNPINHLQNKQGL